MDAIGDELERHGCDRHGNEVMYDGVSGQRFETTVFLGPTYYQRLKHMAVDKIHQRARGPRQVLTHQPLEGRSREGGLRMGECVRRFSRPPRKERRPLRTQFNTILFTRARSCIVAEWRETVSSLTVRTTSSERDSCWCRILSMRSYVHGADTLPTLLRKELSSPT